MCMCVCVWVCVCVGGGEGLLAVIVGGSSYSCHLACNWEVVVAIHIAFWQLYFWVVTVWFLSLVVILLLV